MTLQHVYASNLLQDHGYPLRNPTPNATIPPSSVEGLQIGDVGYVDNYGEFNLVFNIRWPPKELANEIRKHSINFTQPTPRRALDPDTVLMTGVERNPKDASADYVFTTTSSAGAILILPEGAILFELQDKQQLDALQKLAIKCALQWCKHNKLDSLYLITAIYKSRYWTLGSFSAKSSPEEILVDCRPGNSAGEFIYHWNYRTNVDHKQGPRKNNHLNQTVFIKGFKMTVRWDRFPVVSPAERFTSWFSHFFATLWLTMSSWWWLSRISVQYVPTSNLSQPHHPLDVINRVLLEKNPGAQVAVTHDDDWIGMHERGLPLESLTREDHVRPFMSNEHKWNLDSRHCNSFSLFCGIRWDFSRHCLFMQQFGTSGNRKQAQSAVDPSNHSSSDSPRLAILHMRLESIEIDRIDAGVCVFIQFGQTTRRTTSKPHASVVEWDDEITLPTNIPVSFIVCTVFQLGSPLGTREISTKQTIDTKALIGGAHMIRLSVGKLDSSSLLITLGEHFSRLETCSSRNEEMSAFVENTKFAFKAFYSYRDDAEEEHLQVACKYFQHALERSVSNNFDHATALFNLATLEFIMFQAHGAYLKLATPFERYEKALELRKPHHPDRPATLLLLAQALLSRLGQEYDELIHARILQLLTEICLGDSRDRRTADAIIRACRFYRTINSRNPADSEVNELLRNLDRGAYVFPYGCFDRPHMLHKMGIALWSRFQRHMKFDDLDRSIELNEEALSLIPDGHHDRTSIDACVRSSFLVRRIEHGEGFNVVDMEELLAAATKLKLQEFDILRTICDLLEGKGRVREAIMCHQHIGDRLTEDTNFADEQAQWRLGFQRCCERRLEKLVEVAFDSGNYSEAAEHLSALLSLDLVDHVDVFIKRSEVRAMMGLWNKALNDADEAIKLHSSSRRGYEMRHAALHGVGRHDEAAEALDVILSKLEGSPNDVLAAAVKFKHPMFHVFRVICDVLEGNGRVMDAIAYFRRMESGLVGDTCLYDERVHWELDFQHRCEEKLEKLADMAMDSGKYSEGAEHLSTILSLNPVDRATILNKRCEARIMMELWDEALSDADECIKLHPSSCRGYGMRYAVLQSTGRYSEAVEALNMILSSLEGSPHDVLSIATKFKLPKFYVFRAICDVLEGNGLVAEAMVCFRRMKNEVTEDTNSADERTEWELDFRRRCDERLGKLKRLIDDVWTGFPRDLTGQVTKGSFFPVASGGSADIYEGKLSVGARSIGVAIKIFKIYPEHGHEQSRIRRFHREIALWSKMNHPNVLPLLGTISDERRHPSVPATVSPWMENGALTPYLERNGDLTVAERLFLVNDVAHGLQYLHSQHVIHGDLSGSNVLVGADGSACIADFGLSTLLTIMEPAPETSCPGNGTIRWMAPEMLDPDTVTFPNMPSDVYSFGSVMLQILTGHVPYHHVALEPQVIYAILRGKKPERSDSEFVTDHRWTFIERCWFREPDERPSSDEVVKFMEEELAESMAADVRPMSTSTARQLYRAFHR